MDHRSSFQPLETQTLQNVDGTTALSKEFCGFICLSEIPRFFPGMYIIYTSIFQFGCCLNRKGW